MSWKAIIQRHDSELKWHAKFHQITKLKQIKMHIMLVNRLWTEHPYSAVDQVWNQVTILEFKLAKEILKDYRPGITPKEKNVNTEIYKNVAFKLTTKQTLNTDLPWLMLKLHPINLL